MINKSILFFLLNFFNFFTQLLKKNNKKSCPRKLLLFVIHSITEKDSKDYIIRESIANIRKEDNVNMDVKVVTLLQKILQYQDGFLYLKREMS